MSIAVASDSTVVDLFQSRENGVEHSFSIGRRAGRWSRVFTKEGVHPYDDIEWKKADALIKKPDGTIVFEQKSIEVPAWWSQTTIDIVADKYFRIINGIKESSVKQMFNRVCSVLRKWAEEQNYFESPEDAQIYEEELIYALLHQYGAFNSPVWFNLGIPDRKQAASACFISAVDDTLDGIMEFQKAEVTIFRGGSGSGANLSHLRSSYEKISSGSYTSGPMSWMEGTDKYAKAMKSGGSTRNAAKMVVLDMDHPDILQTRDGRPGFIKSKAWAEQMAHDLINAGYSCDYDDPIGAYKIVPYQNANHSISIPDSFMKAVEDDLEWTTKKRSNGEVVHTYKARDLWKEISDAAWMCGDPGVQFTDTINRWHTTPVNGPIRSSNPCSEFLHVDNTACNLCALNLTKFFDGQELQLKRFEHAIRLFVTAQNAIIKKAYYPTKEITENSHKLRPIGLNYGDLGALLMNLGYGYDSDEGRATAARMASLMTGNAYLVSAKLAARTTPFADFEKNRKPMLDVMRMHAEADLKILARWGLSKDPISDNLPVQTSKLWADVIDLGEQYGYTMSQATLQAPLGTISFLMGMSTTGIEPAFSLVSYKKLVGGGTMKIVNAGVRDALHHLSYSAIAINRICAYVEERSFIEGAPDLKPEHLSVFDCAMPSGPSHRCVSPLAHVKMMAAIQPLITCAQSKTVNLTSDFTSEAIADIYFQSWKLGVKCVALYRDGSKWSQPMATTERAKEQGTIKSDDSSVPVPTPEVIYANKRRHMPEDRSGTTHRFEVNGHKGYITVNEYDDGTPGEVFLRLGKNGSTMAGLIDGFTQLLSIALQYGVPLDKLIRSFTETQFEPSGYTRNPRIRFARSLYDYLFKYLDLKYFEGKTSGLFDHSMPSDSIAPVASIPVRASNGLMDGPPCSNCGGITHRNGSCYLCNSCGTTTGCS
jgi:ribonucleoside-diphosphate reductase alpha chain